MPCTLLHSMEQGAGSGLQKARIWPLEKYARFVSSAVTTSSSTAAKGLWQHYSSKEGTIQLALVENNHFMISSGSLILESFSLWEAEKWLKVVTKGDSAMFIYKLGGENRRFRVKFSPVKSFTSLEMCRHFTTVLTPLIPVRDMDTIDTSTRDKPLSTRAMESDSQLISYEDSLMLDASQVVPQHKDYQTSQAQSGSGVERGGGAVAVQPDKSRLIPVPDLGKLLQTQGTSLGRAYADTNFPTEQLGEFVRLCLTDTNFPGFVEAVEKELNNMTST